MDIEHDRRIILYPAYLNSKRTVAEGRRIAKDKACEEPVVGEMLAVCTYLKLPAEIERKSYPRDFFNRGRLRVQLKQPDGSLTNPTIPTQLIPKHPERQNRKAAAAAAAAKPIEAAAPAPAAAAASSSGASTSTSSSSKKQGGKKKRK